MNLQSASKVRDSITDQPLANDPTWKHTDFIEFQNAECFKYLAKLQKSVDQIEREIKNLSGGLSPEFYKEMRKLIQEETSKKPNWYKETSGEGSSGKSTKPIYLAPPLAPYGVTDRNKPQDWQYKDMKYKSLEYKEDKS